MPLQKQIVPIQLGDGLDTKTDPKQVVPGKMLTLENCSLKKIGKYKKRNGFTQLANFGTTCTGFVTKKKDLLAFGSGAIKKYNADDSVFIDQTSNSSQSNLLYDPCAISSSSSITGGSNISYFDSCVANNIRLVAWIDATTRSYYQLFNADTGSSISGVTPQALTGLTGIKTIAIGDYLVIFYVLGGVLYRTAVDSLNPTLGVSGIGTAAVVSSSINTTSSVFDVCLLNNTLYVSFYTSGGAITTQLIDSGLTNGINRTFASKDCTFGIATAADTSLNQVWVAHVPTGTDNAKYFIVDNELNDVLTSTNFAATSATLRVENVAMIVSAGSGRIFYDISQVYTAGDSNVGFLYTNHAYRQNATSSGTLATVFDLKNSASIISKPFSYTLNGVSTVCIMLGYNGHSQGYGFVVNEFGNILAKVGLGGIAAGYLFSSYDHRVNTNAFTMGSVPEVITMSATKITIPILQETAVGSDPNISGGFAFSYGVNIVTLDFANSNNLQFVETATQAHITGGFLSHYDGDVFVENGFLTIPEPPQRITGFTGAGTNYFQTGTYQWVLVYEWFDAQNNFHQSAASEIKTVVFSSAKDEVDVLINPNSFSYKSAATYLSIYGTEKNGSIFYRLTAVPSNKMLTVRDNYNAGAGRTGYPQLYTTGGELDNDPMPSPSAIFKYRNRVFIVPSETPNTLWYSKSEIQGIPGTPIEFSQFLTYQANTSNGNVVTGTQIDDKCVLFKPTSLFYFVGDGPNATGSGNDFTPASQIPSAVGTAEPRSVVGFQNGAIFKSLQGWYLIDRSLNATYIGADVEAYNNDTVVSATLMEDSTEIRIVLSSNVAIVYDWFIGKWMVHKNYTSVSASNYNNAYTRILSSGELIQEDDSFSDNGQYIPLKMQTSWLSFAGLQGFQRVYKLIILGDYVSAHAIRVSIQYDFNPNTFQTVEFNPATILDSTNTFGSGTPYGTDSPDNVFGGISFANSQNYQWRIFTTIQKCETIQITIEDVYTGTIGESFSLSGLAFEVGVEGGVMRLPASRSFG
jgi:hypothetical protein